MRKPPQTTYLDNNGDLASGTVKRKRGQLWLKVRHRGFPGTRLADLALCIMNYGDGLRLPCRWRAVCSAFSQRQATAITAPGKKQILALESESMITESQIKGGWTELKGKVKEAWGQVNDDELRELEGSVDQLVGLIQRATGQAREQIEERLRDLDERFRPFLTRAVDQARRYAEQTVATASEQVERLKDNISSGHAEAQQLVKRRPMESVAVAFGAGMIAGVILGLLTRKR